jgi:predicted kinase
MIVIISGHISSGKTTLAKQVALALNAPLLSSDTLREKLQAQPQGAPRGAEFALMTELAFHTSGNLVLDSTGMSYRFRDLVDRLRQNNHPGEIVHIRVFCDQKTWYFREMTRSDRGPLNEKVYAESRDVVWNREPEFSLESNSETFAQALAAIETHNLEKV